MKFNLDRCIGILAMGVMALLLVAMTHVNPSDFLQYLIAYQTNVFYGYVISLVFAAIFLSFDKS